jgi:hypothetical protein
VQDLDLDWDLLLTPLSEDADSDAIMDVSMEVSLCNWVRTSLCEAPRVNH